MPIKKKNTMEQHPEQQNPAEEVDQQLSNIENLPDVSPHYSGVVLFGTVTDRTRRFIPKDNPKTEIITYTIEDDSFHRYFVDDFAPDPDDGYYAIGQHVALSVYVRPYRKKNNELAYTFSTIKDRIVSSQGEHF